MLIEVDSKDFCLVMAKFNGARDGTEPVSTS